MKLGDGVEFQMGMTVYRISRHPKPEKTKAEKHVLLMQVGGTEWFLQERGSEVITPLTEFYSTHHTAVLAERDRLYVVLQGAGESLREFYRGWLQLPEGKWHVAKLVLKLLEYSHNMDVIGYVQGESKPLTYMDVSKSVGLANHVAIDVRRPFE